MKRLKALQFCYQENAVRKYRQKFNLKFEKIKIYFSSEAFLLNEFSILVVEWTMWKKINIQLEDEFERKCIELWRR